MTSLEGGSTLRARHPIISFRTDAGPPPQVRWLARSVLTFQGMQDVRSVALGFMEGANGGWSGHDVLTFVRTLLRAGWLHPADPLGGRVRIEEEGRGAITVATAADVDLRTEGALLRLAEASRQKVVATLRALLAATPDDRFVSAAIYAGRVTREDGVWRPCLREHEPLSDWVLALFAVDALEHRADYDDLLSVCDACDVVSFHETKTRHFCAAHSKNALTLPPPPGLAAR